MTLKSRLTFDCEGPPLVARSTVLTGVGRSGTTILGNILGSLQSVEYDYEALLLNAVPMLEARGQMSRAAAVELLRAYANETMTCHLLGRNVNMRPSDDTLITRRLGQEELQRRWTNTKDHRRDVKEMARQRKSLFLMKAINLMPFYELLFETFRNCHIVHIVRDPFDVAKSVLRRGWVSMDHLREVEGIPIKRAVQIHGKEIMLPWWVADEDVDTFVGASELDRALYYWHVLMEKAQQEKKRLDLEGTGRYLEVRYEHLQADPSGTVDQIARFMQTKRGPQTDALIKTVRGKKGKDPEGRDLSNVHPKWRDRMAQTLDRAGYLVGV